MKVLYKLYKIAIIMLAFSSCNSDKINEKILIKRSNDYFNKKKIDVHNFKWKYYIICNEKVGYKNYVLKYYNVINNDSLIIWFTLDDEAGYFVEGNDNFYRYVRKTEQ